MLSGLQPSFRPYAVWLYTVAEYNRLRPRITSGYRSVSEQARLYSEYRAGRRAYPAAAPGCSQHNYGLAFDMVSDNNPGLGAVWQQIGGYWGGARDPIHFGAPVHPCTGSR